MSNNRTHFVTTSDAVTIGATVTGQGPSLVFLQGIMGDGDLDWHPVLPHLSGRFTCYRQRHSLTGDTVWLGVREAADSSWGNLGHFAATEPRPTAMVGRICG